MRGYVIDVKSRCRAFGKVRLEIIAICLTAPGGFAKTVVFNNFYQIARKRVNPDGAFGRDIYKSQGGCSEMHPATRFAGGRDWAPRGIWVISSEGALGASVAKNV